MRNSSSALPWILSQLDRENRFTSWVCGPSSLHLLKAENGDYPELRNGFRLLLAVWKKLTSAVSSCCDVTKILHLSLKILSFVLPSSCLCLCTPQRCQYVFKKLPYHDGWTTIWPFVKVQCIFQYHFFRVHYVDLMDQRGAEEDCECISVSQRKGIGADQPNTSYCTFSFPQASFRLSEMSGRLWAFSENLTW